VQVRAADVLGVSYRSFRHLMKKIRAVAEGLSLSKTATVKVQVFLTPATDTLSLQHMNLSPVLVVPDFIHQLIDQVDCAAVVGIEVLPWQGSATLADRNRGRGSAHVIRMPCCASQANVALDRLRGSSLPFAPCTTAFGERLGQRQFDVVLASRAHFISRATTFITLRTTGSTALLSPARVTLSLRSSLSGSRATLRRLQVFPRLLWGCRICHKRTMSLLPDFPLCEMQKGAHRF